MTSHQKNKTTEDFVHMYRNSWVSRNSATWAHVQNTQGPGRQTVEKLNCDQKLFDAHQTHTVPEEKRKRERKQLSPKSIYLERCVEIINHCTIEIIVG